MEIMQQNEKMTMNASHIQIYIQFLAQIYSFFLPHK